MRKRLVHAGTIKDVFLYIINHEYEIAVFHIRIDVSSEDGTRHIALKIVGDFVAIKHLAGTTG